jgi:hypothetical protein
MVHPAGWTVPRLLVGVAGRCQRIHHRQVVNREHIRRAPLEKRPRSGLYLMLEEPPWLRATRGACAVASAGKDARLRNL